MIGQCIAILARYTVASPMTSKKQLLNDAHRFRFFGVGSFNKRKSPLLSGDSNSPSPGLIGSSNESNKRFCTGLSVWQEKKRKLAGRITLCC